MYLHSIREKATGWVAWIIVGLISIPFAFWGINSYITPDSNPAVANVGEYKITVQEFQNSVQSEFQKYKGQIDDALVKQLVLERLINNRAMLNYLSDAGFSISKQQVDNFIRSEENFQIDGQFSEEVYNRSFPSAHSKAYYRNAIASDLLIQQFSKGVLNASVVSDSEVTRVIELIRQKRDISHVIINSQDFSGGIEVSDEEIQQYYQNFQNKFENPEQIKLAYLELSRQDIAETLTVTDEELEKYYQDNSTQYSTPERRKASHILFTFPTDVDDQAKADIKPKAADVLKSLKEGADFAELAKTHSQDPGSSENGGDLGFFGPGEMVPAFEKVAFELNPGDISDLVESPFGYHIIKLTDIQGGTTKPLADVKDEITKALKFELAENPYFEKAEEMQTLAYEQPDALEPVANALQMTLKESQLFGRQGGEGIFSNRKLLDAAFSELVLEEGNNSDLIELDNDHVAVIRVIERNPANIKPLAEVKEEIKAQLQLDQVIAKAQKKADDIIKALQEGGTVQEVIEAKGLEIVNSGLVERQTASLPREILSKAFTMPRETKYSTTPVAGDIAVVIINSIEPGNSEDKLLFESIKSALVQNKGNVNTTLSMMQIRSESEVKINQEVLKAQE